MKICPKCLQSKALINFSRASNTSDGVQAWCKACHNAYNRTRQQQPDFQLTRTPPLSRDRIRQLWDQGLQRCPTCETIKPVDEFHLNRRKKNGISSECKTCVVSRVCLQQQMNPEKTKAKWGRYIATHTFYEQQRNAVYKRLHRSQARQRESERYQQNPLPFLIKGAIRRARMHGAKVIEPIVPLVVYERDRGICHLCHRKVANKNISMDHLVPVSDKIYFPEIGHTYINIALAHKTCNSKRGNRYQAAQLRLFGLPEGGVA